MESAACKENSLILLIGAFESKVFALETWKKVMTEKELLKIHFS